MTFVVLIAVRVFHAEAWQKATLVAASSFGLLLSLFPVQLVRRTGISVNVGTAVLWCVSAVCLLGDDHFPPRRRNTIPRTMGSSRKTRRVLWHV